MKNNHHNDKLKETQLNLQISGIALENRLKITNTWIGIIKHEWKWIGVDKHFRIVEVSNHESEPHFRDLKVYNTETFETKFQEEVLDWMTDEYMARHEEFIEREADRNDYVDVWLSEIFGGEK